MNTTCIRRTSESAHPATKKHSAPVFEQVDSNATDICLAAIRAESLISLCDKVLGDSEIEGSAEHLQVIALVHAAHAELESIRSNAEDVNIIARSALQKGGAA